LSPRGVSTAHRTRTNFVRAGNLPNVIAHATHAKCQIDWYKIVPLANGRSFMFQHYYAADAINTARPCDRNRQRWQSAKNTYIIIRPKQKLPLLRVIGVRKVGECLKNIYFYNSRHLILFSLHGSNNSKVRKWYPRVTTFYVNAKQMSKWKTPFFMFSISSIQMLRDGLQPEAKVFVRLDYKVIYWVMKRRRGGSSGLQSADPARSVY